MNTKPRLYQRVAFNLIVAVVIGVCFGARSGVAQSTDPSMVGEWSTASPDPFPLFPVHAHLLPTGKVMFWSNPPGIDARSWDPANQTISTLPPPGYDVFCAGHSFLPDGTLFVAGGNNSPDPTPPGFAYASIYDPEPPPLVNPWTGPPVIPDMNAGRWYPTATVLANGDVLVISGMIDSSPSGINTLPQVFQVGNRTWRDLTSAELGMDCYPRMFLAPNGKVFKAAPEKTTRYLDTTGTGTWSLVGDRVAQHEVTGEVGINRNFGSEVMYAPGKVLVTGGGDPPTKTAEVIDLTQSSPTWRAVGSMAVARRQLNATLLPDGTVLVTGGTRGSGFNNTDPGNPVYAAELWDPATETWTTLASTTSGIPRVYHSCALLLPDARVLSMGGNGQMTSEIYSPPYLFKGTRPAITSAPTSVAYGQSFFVGTPDGNFKGHDAETLLGDPCFQHEPADQHVELFAGPWRPPRCGSFRKRCCCASHCCASRTLHALHPQRKRSTVGRKNRPSRQWPSGANGNVDLPLAEQRCGRRRGLHAYGERKQFREWFGGALEWSGSHHYLREREPAHRANLCG